jgi:hypothetical protein
MKLESMRQVWIRKKSGKSNLEPLYTLTEIADKLGLEYKIVVAYMKGKRENKPKPAMQTQSMTTSKKNLYKLSEFKTWLKHLGVLK